MRRRGGKDRSMATVGFIGVGNMGGPMAANLLAAGHRVRAFDLAEEAVARVVAKGGEAADDLGAAVREVDAVVTMLPAGRQVAAAYLDEGGILALAPRDAILIDASTIDVATSRTVHAAAAAAGHAKVDAPVSGGVGGAEAATLTFMVGGGEAAVAAARPYLEVMGKRIVHTGEAGAGQAAKLCNNLILGISMIGVAEAFVLADALGLDRQKLFDVASSSSGQCWSLTSYCPAPGPVPGSPANRDYAAGFSVDMMLKDLKLAAAAAAEGGSSAPLGAAAAQLYQLLSDLGAGKKDFSFIIKMLEGNLQSK
ncbi:MAG: 3-hydroxyisobutyrate dehydrogenase [Pseudomonadota bacterium]